MNRRQQYHQLHIIIMLHRNNYQVQFVTIDEFGRMASTYRSRINKTTNRNVSVFMLYQIDTTGVQAFHNFSTRLYTT